MVFVAVSTAIFLCPLYIQTQSPCLIEPDELPEKPKLIGHRGAPMVSLLLYLTKTANKYISQHVKLFLYVSHTDTEIVCFNSCKCYLLPFSENHTRYIFILYNSVYSCNMLNDFAFSCSTNGSGVNNCHVRGPMCLAAQSLLVCFAPGSQISSI